MHRITPLTASAIAALAFVSTSAFAGRPLSVDDANIDDKGTGHIEAWAAREPGKADVINVAPAYSPWQVVELSGLLSRNRTNSISSVGVLARVQVTEPKKSGCNFLVALGHQHFSPGRQPALRLYRRHLQQKRLHAARQPRRCQTLERLELRHLGHRPRTRHRHLHRAHRVVRPGGFEAHIPSRRAPRSGEGLAGGWDAGAV